MEFVLLGYSPKEKEKMKKEIVSMGGKVVTKIQNTVMAVISTSEEMEKMTSRIGEAEFYQIHVVSSDFLEEAKSSVGKIPDLVIKKSICLWGADVSIYNIRKASVFLF